MITIKLMKALVTLLMVLLVSGQVNAQVFGKKKSKDADPRDAQIDSLTNLTKTLTLQVDSLSLALGEICPGTRFTEGSRRYNFGTGCCCNTSSYTWQCPRNAGCQLRHYYRRPRQAGLSPCRSSLNQKALKGLTAWPY